MKHHPPERNVSRRQLIRTAGATAAGGLLLREAIGRDENPAAQVADRGADLRITALRAYRLGSRVYVKIETNRKLHGWGEITQSEPNVAKTLATSLFDLLEGENPTRIEHLWQKLYRAHRDIRGGPLMTHAISAIDEALWDITGKAWQVPVYRLLGGPTREKIRMYPSATSYKIGPGGPRPFAAAPGEIQGMVDHVAAIRKRLGPDGAVMVDVHCAFPPPHVIQLAAAIQPYDILFLEEPAVPGNIEVFKRIKAQVNIPLATGERDRTIWGVIPYLQEGCIDILQPDVGHTGGISQMRKIATLAEAWFVPLAPHSSSTLLGLTASLHVTFSIPLFLIHEGGKGNDPFEVVKKTWEVDKEGYASLPQGPGLGVDIDEEKVRRIDAAPQKPYNWPSAKYPDGSVADY